ncbi:MAG TPA: DUF1684 domain-containing protein [Cytophagaceae bacterium]
MKVGFEKITLKTLAIGATIAAVIIILSHFATDKNTYPEKINEYRRQKDNYFKSAVESPIENKATFEGLHYFEPNEKYKVNAKITLLNDTVPLTVKKNDGRESNYLKFALATFTIDGKEQQLTLLKNMEESDKEEALFLPFYDKTNGESTYPGGRYLDLVFNKKSGSITIDFNLAYNPYCVYSYKYSCPLPPPENRLDMKIEAGEKYIQKIEE